MGTGNNPDTSFEMKEDRSIELSCGSFEELQNKINRLIDGKQKVVYDIHSVTPHPTLLTLAKFASTGYNDLDKEQFQFPDEWQLLTTARSHSHSNSYFGAVFSHSRNYQVEIVHRGTATKCAVLTDFRALMGKEMDPQIETACTFVKRVNTILRHIEIENENGIHFQVFITGHSLGGWLAQVTTFALEYLAIRDSRFVRADLIRIGETRHAHTVTFKSTGCKGMLSKMKRKFGTQCSKKALHITTYLLSQSLINSFREHVGQIFSMTSFNSTLENCEQLPINNIWGAHAMNTLLKALEQEKLKILTVTDKPAPSLIQGLTRWIYSFHSYVPMSIRSIWENRTTLLEHDENLSPTSNVSHDNCELVECLKPDDSEYLENSGMQPHCITKPVDKGKTHLRVFTESEKMFLEMYVVLRKFPMQCKSDVLFEAIKNNTDRDQVQKSLADYWIDNDHIHNENVALQLFISYIQQLLHRHSEIIAATKQQTSEYNIRKECYQNEHLRFINSMRKVQLDFIEKCGPVKFSVWQVINDVHCDIHRTTLKVYHQTRLNDTYKEACTVLKLNQLLQVKRYLSFQELVSAQEMSDHLFIIECKQHTYSYKYTQLHEELQNLFHCIGRVVNEKPGIKFIFITRKNDSLATIIQDEYRDKLGSRFLQTDEALKWDDLNPNSQNEILKKVVVHFQGKETCLNDFINIPACDYSIIFDSATLNQLITGEHVILGNEPQRLSDLPAAFTDICEVIPETSFINVLRQYPEDALFMITSSSNISRKEILLQDLNIPDDHAKTLIDKITLVVGLEEANIEKRWKTLCRKHHSKIILWVEEMKNHLFCKKIYNPTLYFQRQLHLIDLKCHIKEILMSKSTCDAFVISNVTDKDKLVNLFGISENQLDNFICFAPTETEAENLFNDQRKRCTSVHWMKVDPHGHLIWYRSHGSLDILRKYQRPENVIVVDEDRLCTSDCKYTDRIFIIAGAPGMGKSTTLTRLAEHVDGWVIRRDLMSCQQAIANLPLYDFTLKHVIDFLAKTEAGFSVTPLFNSLLAFGLESKTKKALHLMFDGFYEIDGDAQKRFLKLLQFLKEETKCNIWVTTQNICKERLEDTLSAFAITFKEVDEELQQNFLFNFWKVRCTVMSNIQPAALKEHANKLLSQTKRIFGNETNSWLGVPLQLRMIAEAYPSHLGSQSTESSNIQNESDLFQAFVEKKFDIYFNEKKKFGKHFADLPQQWLSKSFLKKHRVLAFQTLFPNNAENFFRKKLDCINSDMVNLNQYGVIQYNIRDNNYSFVHRSFAEYFLADLILHWLKKPHGRHQIYPSVEDFLLNTILIKPENKVIRLLIDGLLAKSKNFNMEFYKCRIASCLAEKEEEYYNSECRTAIYIALEENLINLLEYLIGCFDGMQSNLGKLLSSRDKHRKSVLYVAAEKLHSSMSTNNDIVEIFLNRIKDAEVSIQKGVLLAACFRTAGDQKNAIVKNLLNIAESYPNMQSITGEIREKWKLITPFLNSVAKKGMMKDAEKLLNDAENGEIGQIFRRYLVATTDNHDKTALYLAAKSGDTHIVNLLLQEGANVNSNYDLVTPLHAAAENGHIKVVTHLILKNAHVNAIDKEQKTPLHYAVAGKSNIKVVTTLLESGASINARDKEQKTLLHYAVAKGDKEIVIVLLENGALPHIANPDDTFCCLPDNFEMNAETFPKNLRYNLFSKQIPKTPETEMSDIADCYYVVIQEATKSLGPQDIITLNNLAALAKQFFKHGNYKQLLHTYRDILKEVSKTLDPSHNDVLRIQISIAQIMSILGNHDDALLIYEGVLEKQLETLGSNNLNTLYTKQSIAKILSHQGKCEDALRYYQQIFENLPDHKNNYHDRLIAAHNIAQLLAYMGHYSESLKLYKENDDKFSKSFGESHPFTLITKLNIAQVLSNNSDYDNALHYYDICNNSKKKVGIAYDGRTFEETAIGDKAKTLHDKAQNSEFANNV